MKILTKALLLMSVFIVLFSCDNLIDSNDPEPINGDVLEKKTVEIGSSGGTISLTDGSSVSISQGILTQNVKITVILYSKEKIFSSENHKAIDVSCDADISEAVSVKLKVPANLNDDQISLFNYNPNQNSMIISGELPEYTYDKINGYIQSTANTVPKVKGERLQGGSGLSSWVAEWDKNIEPDENTKLIKMPFYEQPGRSCWATCATMLAKSIMPYTDKTKEVEVCNFLQRCGTTRDEGINVTYFLRVLLSAMHYYTGGGFESTGYVRLSALKEKIISEIDKGHPVIINMEYPGVSGAHVILAIGYTKTSNSYKLIYHNPQGTGDETMYMERDINQLFIKKAMHHVIQILYPKEVPHPDRTLYTIGMPLGAVGYITFPVPYKQSSYTIELNENINNSDGYSWFWGDREMNTIPDTAKTLEIKLPLRNASKGEAFAGKINIFIVKNDLPTPVYDKMEDITINSGSEATWYKLSIPLSQFVKAGGSKGYRISAKLYDNAFNYLDGFDVKVNIEPQKEKNEEPNSKTLSFTTNEDWGGGVAKFKIEVNYELTGYGVELYSENPENFALPTGKLATINASGKVTVDQLKQKVGDDKDYVEYSFGTPKVVFRSTTNSSYNMTSETRNTNPYTGTFYAVEGKNIIIESAVSIPVISKRYEDGVMTYKSEDNLSREGKQCWIRAKK